MAALDQAMGFTIPTRHARGRLARLGPVLNAVLAAHQYPPAIERLLAEALVLTALLGVMLKGEGGQLTLQAQTESGVVKLLVCDFRDGEVRGYVDFDKDRLAMYGKTPSLRTLMGKGYLAITFDQAVSDERYQGIVPLDAPTLSEAAELYFSQSEQIPSFVRIAVTQVPGQGCVAGGILIQHLPEGDSGRDRIHTRLDHPEWEHVRILSSTVKEGELCDAALPLETLVWRLFNEEQNVRNIGVTALTKGCRCNLAHIQDVLSRFPATERAEMADKDGIIAVDCAFCAKIFPISASVQ